MNKDLVKLILKTFVIGALIYLVVYIYLNVQDSVDVNKDTIFYGTIIFGAYLIANAIYVTIKQQKGFERFSQKYVDTQDAIVIWMDCAMNHWKVEHKIKDGHAEAIPPSAVKLLNTRPLVAKESGERSLVFEMRFEIGDNPGIHTIIIPLARGKQYIQNNWQQCISLNKPLNTADKHLKEMARHIDSTQDFAQRTELAKIEASAFGLDNPLPSQVPRQTDEEPVEESVEVVEDEEGKERRE